MRTPFGFMGGSRSITTSANWTVAATNSTLTVPSGNPGTLKFTSVVADVNAQYSKNNAAYVTFVSNDTLTVADTNTLKFKDSSNGLMSCTVLDNTTGAVVGIVGF